MSNTTADEVRKALPSLLYNDEPIGEIEAGFYIELSIPAVDVPTILKDGSTLTKGTDFTFIRPDQITLTVEAAGEEFITQCYYGQTDTIIDGIIDKADRIITDFFASYGSPSALYAKDWSTWLSASIYLMQYAGGTDGGLELSREYNKKAKDGMKAYAANTFDGDKEVRDRTRKYVVLSNA
jgi:hypothetical protein